MKRKLNVEQADIHGRSRKHLKRAKAKQERREAKRFLGFGLEPIDYSNKYYGWAS